MDCSIFRFIQQSSLFLAIEMEPVHSANCFFVFSLFSFRFPFNLNWTKCESELTIKILSNRMSYYDRWVQLFSVLPVKRRNNIISHSPSFNQRQRGLCAARWKLFAKYLPTLFRWLFRSIYLLLSLCIPYWQRRNVKQTFAICFFLSAQRICTLVCAQTDTRACGSFSVKNSHRKTHSFTTQRVHRSFLSLLPQRIDYLLFMQIHRRRHSVRQKAQNYYSVFSCFSVGRPSLNMS